MTVIKDLGDIETDVIDDEVLYEVEAVNGLIGDGEFLAVFHRFDVLVFIDVGDGMPVDLVFLGHVPLDDLDGTVAVSLKVALVVEDNDVIVNIVHGGGIGQYRRHIAIFEQLEVAGVVDVGYHVVTHFK